MLTEEISYQVSVRGIVAVQPTHLSHAHMHTHAHTVTLHSYTYTRIATHSHTHSPVQQGS
jgi:hypothetical protein